MHCRSKRLTLLEQGLPALEACDDNVHDKGPFCR
jgi:hypothetical protein